MPYLRGSISGLSKTQPRAAKESLSDMTRNKTHKSRREAQSERRTELSAACKKGIHSSCFALNCKCECGHGAK